jgi:hypothetical protein
MVLCECVKQCKICDLYLGRWGRFHNVLGDRPTKWPIAKKETPKHLSFGMHCYQLN